MLKKARRRAVNEIYPDPKTMLSKLKTELYYLHRGFDMTTDPILIDSLIYEIMSVNMKYKFFLNMCRDDPDVIRDEMELEVK